MIGRRNISIWLAVLVCLAVSASPATAETIYVDGSTSIVSFSGSVSFDHDQVVSVSVYDCPASLDYTFLSDTVSLPQFDPAWGILKSVELVVESTIDVETHYWYDYDAASSTQYWYSNVIASVDGLGATFSQTHNVYTTGIGYHDHAFPINGSASDSASTDLTAFIGTSTVDVDITGDDKLCAWWNHYDHIDTDTYGTVTVTLTYNYAPDPDAHDVELYETILSGDLAGDDVQGLDPWDLLNEPTRGENSYHVLIGSGTEPNAILDGFTITAGNANGADTNSEGGGMFNASGSPTVTNCIFSRNSAVYGSGMHNASSSPAVTDCSFTENSASNAGGGMYNYNNSMMLIRCTFTGNTVTVNGGGVYNTGGSSTITDCIFSGNSADYGGGMYNVFSASPTVTNCVFLNNTATGLSAGWEGGGGMVNQASASPTLINCVFRGNDEYGMCNFGYGGSSQATVINCILWGDIPSEICNIDGNAAVTYSDVQGGYDGTGNINTDPNFVDADNPDPNLVNLRLLPVSPCIDAADSTPLLNRGITKDLDGLMRFTDMDAVPDTGAGLFTFTDMGAYEYNCNYILGDNNCDGKVDLEDLMILSSNWLAGT